MSTCIVGKFESFHRGHQLLIERAKQFGEDVKLISIWLPFNLKEYVPLFSEEERKELSRAFGVELRNIAFEKVRDMSPEEFFKLLKRLGCRRIVAGEDWRFGKGRGGDISTAMKLGRAYSIDVVPVKPILVGGRKIGTSQIRKLLTEGMVEEANSLLGFNYFCLGSPEKGRGVGRKIGYPTINVSCRKKLILKPGVYKVKVNWDGVVKVGVANFGTRPTFKLGEEKVLEVHIPGEKVECLNCGRIRVEFLKFIREERRFESVEELKEQIAKDIRSLGKILR